MPNRSPENEMASLGSAEAEILQLVWRLEEASAQDIWEALPKGRTLAPATVLTVLRRLRDKKFIKSRAVGKAHFFSPAIQPERVISKTVRDLLQRFFGGEAGPLVMHLAETKQLDREDVERLRNLLRESEKQDDR